MRKSLGDLDWNVTEIELEHGVSAGITIAMHSRETVPPYYEHLARVRANKSLQDWVSMDRWEKALIVALMFTDNAIQNHQAEAEINKARANAKSAQE